MADRSKIIELLATGPDTGIAFVVAQLELIEVAQLELASYRLQYPEHAADLDRAFQALKPGDLRGFGQMIYRAHVRELLDRVVDGDSLAYGTDAEIVGALSMASLKAPLGVQAAALFEGTFARLFPAEAVRALDGPPRAEPWQGASREMAMQLRRKLRNPERRLSA